MGTGTIRVLFKLGLLGEGPDEALGALVHFSGVGGSALVRLELPTTCNDLSMGFLHTSVQTSNKGLITQLSGPPVVVAHSWPPQVQVSIPDVRSPQFPSVSGWSRVRSQVEGTSIFI